jgi:hypothetical protein
MRSTAGHFENTPGIEGDDVVHLREKVTVVARDDHRMVLRGEKEPGKQSRR